MPTIRLSRILLPTLLTVMSQFSSWTEAATSVGSSNERVVCYYTNWAVYRQGIAKYSPENINPYLCTHLVYAFGGLTKDFEMKPFDNYQDIEKGGYAKFVGLKTYNKELKTMIAVGGWNEGSARWSPLVSTKENRKTFIRSAIRFLRTYNFDGLDLDWEYPAFRDGGQPEDKENYATLVQELRTAFEREAAKSKKDRLLLTMAVPAGKDYVDRGYDIPKLNKYLDFFNMLTYDYHSAFEPQANHHAPLYIRRGLSDFDFKAELNIDFTVRYYIEEGADRDKLVLGIPSYGRSYTLFNPDANDMGSPAEGPGEPGKYTKEKGYMAFYEVCENIAENEWKVKKVDPGAVGPYAYKGNQWVGYDDEQIAARKAMYVRDQKLGGIMFWSIDNDDFRGLCNGQPYPLIEGAKAALLSRSNSTSKAAAASSGSDSSSSRLSKSKQSPAKSDSSSSSSSTGGNRLLGGGGGGNANTRRPLSRLASPSTRRRTNLSLDELTRRGKEQQSSGDDSSSSSSSDADGSRRTTPRPPSRGATDPSTTPEPPTTPDPGTDFTCKEEGFFSHPRQCSKYFWCLDTPNLGLVSHSFTCPAGLYFNRISGSCDYPNNVICTKPKDTTTKAPFKTTTPATTTPYADEDVGGGGQERERPRGYQLPTDEELFGGLDEEPAARATSARPEATTSRRQRTTPAFDATTRTTRTTTTAKPRVTDAEEASIQELLAVIDGLGGVAAVKELLAKERDGQIITKSPQLTYLDRDALTRAVSALDAQENNSRKGNSLQSFSGARGPQFIPSSDRDVDGGADESGAGGEVAPANPGGNQRGPQYVHLDRRRNHGGEPNEEEDGLSGGGPTEEPETRQRPTFSYVVLDRRSSTTTTPTPPADDGGAAREGGGGGGGGGGEEEAEPVGGLSEDGKTFTVFAQPVAESGPGSQSPPPARAFPAVGGGGGVTTPAFPEYVTLRRERPQPTGEEEEEDLHEPATDGLIQTTPSTTEKPIHIRPLSFRRTRPTTTTTSTVAPPPVERSRVRFTKAPSPSPSPSPSPLPASVGSKSGSQSTLSRNAVFDVAKRRSSRPPSRLFPRRDPPGNTASLDSTTPSPSPSPAEAEAEDAVEPRLSDSAAVLVDDEKDENKKENVTVKVTFREEIRLRDSQHSGGRTVRTRVKTTEIPVGDADKVSAADVFESDTSPASLQHLLLDAGDDQPLTSAATGVSPVSTQPPTDADGDADVNAGAGRVRVRTSALSLLRASPEARRNRLSSSPSPAVAAALGLAAGRRTRTRTRTETSRPGDDPEVPASARSAVDETAPPAEEPPSSLRRPGIVRTRARLPIRTGRERFRSTTVAPADVADVADGDVDVDGSGGRPDESGQGASTASPPPARRRPARLRQFTPPPAIRRFRTRLPVGSTTAAARANAEQETASDVDNDGRQEERDGAAAAVEEERPVRRRQQVRLSEQRTSPRRPSVSVRRRPIQQSGGNPSFVRTTEPTADAAAGDGSEQQQQQQTRGVSIRPLSRPTSPGSRPGRLLVNRRPVAGSATTEAPPSSSPTSPLTLPPTPETTGFTRLDDGEDGPSTTRQPKSDGNGNGRVRSSREFSAPVVIPLVGDLNEIDIAGFGVPDGNAALQQHRKRQSQHDLEAETHGSASTDVLFATAALTTNAGFHTTKETPHPGTGLPGSTASLDNTPTATLTPINGQFAVDGFTDNSGREAGATRPNATTSRKVAAVVADDARRPIFVTPRPLHIVQVSPASTLLDAFRLQPPSFDFALFRSPLGSPQQQSLFDNGGAKQPFFAANPFGGPRAVSPATIHFSLKPDPDYNYHYYDEPDYESAGLGTDNRFADDYDGVLRLDSKLQTLPDGRVRCLDAGVFAHPQSCRKFVNCVREKDGSELRAWVYTCPRDLAFDPIGAMCNWNDAAFCGTTSQQQQQQQQQQRVKS